MSSVSGSVSSSSMGSGSEHTREGVSSRSGSGASGQLAGEGRIRIEVTTETREDPPEEIVESSLSARAGYRWVAEMLFRWSRLLKSWLNCIPIFERGVQRDIVALERVNAIDCPSPQPFLYFYDTRTKSPTTWLSLISRPGISKLEAFTQSFKHFKDGFFKVDMKREKLALADREVVETLMKFNDKMPTKGLVRVYYSIHPIVDIEGHMAQLGKKNLNLFQALRKEKTAKVKSAGNTEVPNLQNPLVEVHLHGDSKRKAEVPAKQGGGKDVRSVRVDLLGPGSSSGVNKHEAGLIELPETIVRFDIDINLSESLVNSIDNMELNAMVKEMLEFSNTALILGRGVGSLYQRELKEGSRSKVKELKEEREGRAVGGEEEVGVLEGEMFGLREKA
ncbi:hypothetical protein DEO72_LG1g2320 [Vigna unguiculata]|uniref:Uncharacterized protein n=1 Tax=Vigna unguiculata TaxID=3917 RepID=A0A4D6KY03_VIGUN|nr:hypothetical protein DEO72_LG1g2320 [Vigna unguiculata]